MNTAWLNIVRYDDPSPGQIQEELGETEGFFMSCREEFNFIRNVSGLSESKTALVMLLLMQHCKMVQYLFFILCLLPTHKAAIPDLMNKQGHPSI